MDRKGFLHRILFLDIETVSLKAHFEELSLREQLLFEKKTAFKRKGGEPTSEFYKNAALWAEFGKVICISTAVLTGQEKASEIVLKSFYGDDERQILTDFKLFLTENFNSQFHLLCAHNGKEFDFPYLARRMLINQISLPDILNLFGKKPWQIRHLDTMDLWKFGDYKHYTSLDLLANVFGIESPKNDLKGSDINETYYGSDDLTRIVKYCERDAVTVLKVYLRLIGITEVPYERQIGGYILES